MITNSDLLAYGRQRQMELDGLDNRVKLMARIATLRENIRRDSSVLMELESELALENEQFRQRSQLALKL